MRITMVYGTRPEAIKLSQVAEALRAVGNPPQILCTNQHTDLLRGTPAEDTMRPDVSLGLPSQNDPMAYARLCEGALRAKWAPDSPGLVVVQGDTASAYAGALAAHALEIPVAHVEAGIRSGDLKDPWPEEGFRVGIDGISCWQFCATEQNLENVTTEPDFVNGEPAKVTGNPGIDALYAHTQPSDEVQDRVLVTLHRRESFGAPLQAMSAGVIMAAGRYPSLEFVWPLHPNPEVYRALGRMVNGAPTPQNLLLINPQPTIPFARMLAASRCVITDSGGVQEEAAALGVPCIVARDKTDRPESVELGYAQVVGRTPDGIRCGLEWALGFIDHLPPNDCFGDGKAAPRIVEHLLNGAP